MSTFRQLMMRKKEEIMYATIKGTLTENDGVFSGFAYNNYLATQEILDTSKDFEICIKTNTGTMTNEFRTLFRNTYGDNHGTSGFSIGLVGAASSKKIRSYITDSSGSYISNGDYGITTIAQNIDCFFRLSQKLNNGTYTITLESSTDGTNWTTENTWTSSLPIRSSGQGVAFGGGSFSNTNQFWSGSIDLNRSYIKLGSTKYKLQAVVGYTVVGSPTITDGVVSGLTQSNYIKLSEKIQNIDWQNLHIHTEFEVSSLPSVAVVFCIGAYNIKFNVRSGNYLYFQYRALSSPNALQSAFSNTSVIPLNSNITVELDCIKDTSAHLVVKSGTNILWDFSTSDFTINGNDDFLYGTDIAYFGGNNLFINLNNTYIKIDGKLWFNGQQA